MAKYRGDLPQIANQLFLTDGGLETTLVFHNGLDLPLFAAFDLLKDEQGRATLRDYYDRYAAIARADGLGFVLESPTWRASADWGFKLGYSAADLDRANRQSIELMEEVRRAFENGAPMVISGCVGPRGDGYHPDALMTAEQAEAYHTAQVATFADTAADMVTAVTMTHAGEAIGITRAARAAGMPVAISFTLETDGRLPSGQNLREAIRDVDAATEDGPAYYMINCAHPSHFMDELAAAEGWTKRIRGVRANASKRSHAELDSSPDLDDGNPIELAADYVALRRMLPGLTVLGGCCGTDHRHVEQICRACR
jgi:S-methylmethionine-dependent homocysteine/selenocysteine methylase